MIVDTKGVIAFMGHPAHRSDLVKDFDSLLDGKALEGVKSKDGGDDEEEDGAAVTVNEIKDQFNQIGKFDAIAKELQTECKEDAKVLMRNFCVMTLSAAYNPKDGTWTSDYMNHRVLVGD